MNPFLRFANPLLSTLFDLKDTDRVFPFTKSFINNAMARTCKTTGVKKIRIHDIRHSHASYLINLDCVPLLISERLGHEKIQTTLSTYSHLYPNKHQEIVDIMQNQHRMDVAESQKKGSQPKNKKLKVVSPENITSPKQVHEQPFNKCVGFAEDI